MPGAMTSSSIALLAFSSVLLQEVAGYESLFMGHSFFRPVADRMLNVTAAAEVSHSQRVVSRGGENGAPEALWNDVLARLEIQRILDTGDIELFGMTYEPTYPTLTGYELWFDYALSKNPNTVFMLALPWADFPSTYTTDSYASFTRKEGQDAWNDLLEGLQDKYPGVTIINSPYGLGPAELRLLFDAGLLPDVNALTGPAETSLYRDIKGHAGRMIIDLSSLIWLNRIYGVDLSTYEGPLDYTTDLREIAVSILDAFDGGDLCGNSPCSCVDDDARIAELAGLIGEPWVSECADVRDFCEVSGQEGNAVRKHCCKTCNF